MGWGDRERKRTEVIRMMESEAVRRGIDTLLRFGCLLLEKVKNQETWLVERKVGLFRMLAFWEDGRLLSKGPPPRF